jgi:hypothetical protein
LYRAAGFLIDNEKVPVENFKRLLDLGLQNFHELVHNQRGIDIVLMFCKVEDPRLIKSMFLAGHWLFIRQVELSVAIEQCIKEARYDLLAEITDNRKISYYTLYLGDVEKAREYGFKLHRSVAKELGYYTASKIFKQYTVDVEDDEDGWWARQVQVYNEFTYTDIPDSKEINRLIVFSNYETLNDDGFYYPNVLYDIIDVQYLYEHKYNGKNCGPYAHDFEPEWTDQIKTFYWDGNDFSSGRDGGCLNCGGNYFVKIL